jgi:hypothetical protein
MAESREQAAYLLLSPSLLFHSTALTDPLLSLCFYAYMLLYLYTSIPLYFYTMLCFLPTLYYVAHNTDAGEELRDGHQPRPLCSVHRPQELGHRRHRRHAHACVQLQHHGEGAHTIHSLTPFLPSLRFNLTPSCNDMRILIPLYLYTPIYILKPSFCM